MMQSHIQAYKGNTNVYGPLWTPTCICAMCTYFLIILYIFPLLFFPERTLSSTTLSTIVWQTFPITTASYMSSPPIFSYLSHNLLSFVRTFSPQFTCINRVDTMLYSTLIWVLCSLSQHLFKHWNQLHCSLQAFGLYCQRLPGFTTKSIHYYLHSSYFCTRFTSITLRIPPLTLSFHPVPLNSLAPKLTTTTVIRCLNSHNLATRTCQLYNWVPHTSSNSNKLLFK